ncbi:MAG: arsenate reductase ArsC [Candidatus Nezhaarchaeales archaeon]
MSSSVKESPCRVEERKVLFVCIGNSFRSQIAEAYFNSMAPPGCRAISAGVKPAISVHPNAIKLMAEEGIDISRSKPKPLTEEAKKADIVVIVCDELEKECPVIYAKRLEHWRLPDPAKMCLEDARKVRDTIKRKVVELIEEITHEGLS